MLTTLACIAIVLIVYFWRLTSSDLFISESNAAVNAKTNALVTLYESLGIEAVRTAIASNSLTSGVTASDTAHGQPSDIHALS